MDNNLNVKIFPINEDYIEQAMSFNEINKKEIEEIKNIFLKNLDKYEKNKFIEIINHDDSYEKREGDDIQIIDNYIIEDTIKEYITISMIESKTQGNYDIILFIPTDNDNIRSKINEYIENNNKELINNIIYGSIELYKNPDNIEDLDFISNELN